MTFSNKKVSRTFASSDSKNAWAYLDGIGWRKINQKSTDGVTNAFIMLNEAVATGKPVRGTIDDATNTIYILYL